MTSDELQLMPRTPASFLTTWSVFAVALPIGLVAFDTSSMSQALILGFAVSVAIIVTDRAARRMSTRDCWCMLLIGLVVTATAFPFAVAARGLLMDTSGDDGKARAAYLLARYVWSRFKGRSNGPYFFALQSRCAGSSATKLGCGSADLMSDKESGPPMGSTEQTGSDDEGLYEQMSQLARKGKTAGIDKLFATSNPSMN